MTAGMKTEITVAGEKLEAVCVGLFRQANLLEVLDSIDDVRRRTPDVRKCVLDVSGAEFKLTGIGEFFVGEYAAKRLVGIRISLIIRKGQINRLLENAAYNRGLKIRLTESRPEAEAWLEENGA
jgi:hypothetical protein